MNTLKATHPHFVRCIIPNEIKSASEAFKQKNDQTYALYLFADCLNRGNMQNEAMRVLSEISKSAGGVADVASRTLEMFRTGELRQGQPLPPYVESTRGMLRVSAAFGVGYDTNVLLLDEVVAANVPAKNRGSLFLNPAAQVGYLGKLWGKNFDSRYLVSFTDYTSAETKSFNSLYQRADFLWGSGEQRWGVFGETLFLNRDPFRLYDWMGGVSWNQRRKLSRNEFFDLEIPIRYQAYPLDSDGLAANDRKGEGIQIRGRYRNMTSDHTMILAQVAIDTQVTSGSNYRETQLLLPFYWTFELPGLRSVGLVNSVQAEADGQWYWSSDVKRKDLNLRAGTGLIRRWGKGWNTTLDYTHYKNFSNVDAAKYSKDTFLLMVSHDFL